MNAILDIDRTQKGRAPDCERTQAQHDAFPFSYLPDQVADTFDEALRCYSADLFNGFALLCRRALIASRISCDDADGQMARCAVREIIRIGRVDDALATTIEGVLFAEESEIPPVNATVAAVLLEVVKDVLYESHVRGARFAAATRIRRFFAQEHSERSHERRRRGS